MSESATAPVTTLYLVRHGATPANEMRPYILQGNAINTSLSDTGREQADAVGRFFSHLHIDAVYCSPLIRAVETATEIAKTHDLIPQTIEGIHEVNVGEWEGLDWGTIMERFPDEYATFMANPGETPYLGGEAYIDVQRRALPVLETLRERHVGQSIVVVAHNVVNRSILAPLLNVPIREAKSITQRNTGINQLEHDGERWELITLNACFHLTHPFGKRADG